MQSEKTLRIFAISKINQKESERIFSIFVKQKTTFKFGDCGSS